MRRIRFDLVSKQFVLKHERPRSFQDLFLNVIHRQRSSTKEKYWALRDISFVVNRGAMVGIVGPNGAGKSTVMKLVSRIIEPTSGQIEVVGRVGALLELGSGFHPDLTGRENIYLNGSILGLGRREITEHLDSIIAFAELEQFIDIPVKHYSSGMFVRLGFSVAVHTRPDILLIDEVLAVGDAGFQKKCLDKIAEFRRSGCTIVYVSHNTESVRELCSEVIWLDHGRIKQIGDPDRVISSYVASVEQQATENLDRENIPETQSEQEPGELRIEQIGDPDRVISSRVASVEQQTTEKLDRENIQETQSEQEPGEPWIEQIGDPDRVISSYVASVEQQTTESLYRDNIQETKFEQEDRGLRIQRVEMRGKDGRPQWTFGSGDAVIVRIEYESRELVENPVFSILLHRSDGLYVSSTNTYNIDPLEFGPINGRGTLTVEIDSLDLYSGEYLLSVGAYQSPDPPHWSTPAQFLDKHIKFRIQSEQRHGIMVLPANWKHMKLGNET